MSDSNQKSEMLIEQIKEWQQQVSTCSKSYKNVKEIKEILSKIIFPKNVTDVKEIMNSAASIMSGLVSISFDSETIEGN